MRHRSGLGLALAVGLIGFSLNAGAQEFELDNDDVVQLPDGMWGTLGFATHASGGGAILRLDIGLPDLVSSAPWLVIDIPLYYWSSSSGIAGFEIKVEQIWLLPGIQREWFVIDQAPGLSLIAEAGAGPVISRVKTPDQPFMSGGWDTKVWLGLRAAGAVRYTFPFGLLLQLQPIGVTMTFGSGDTSSGYEIAFMAGYRWK